jgi:hypothetical protein
MKTAPWRRRPRRRLLFTLLAVLGLAALFALLTGAGSEL